MHTFCFYYVKSCLNGAKCRKSVDFSVKTYEEAVNKFWIFIFDKRIIDSLDNEFEIENVVKDNREIVMSNDMNIHTTESKIMTNEQKYKTVEDRTDEFLRSVNGFYTKDMYEGAKSVFEWLEKKANSETDSKMKKIYTVCSQHNAMNIPTDVLFKDKDFDNFEDAVKYCKSMKNDDHKFNFSVIERWV